MNCECVRRDGVLLGSGDLDPRREARIVSHLEACEGCRDALESERRLDALLASLPEAEPRRDIAPAVLRALAQPESPQVTREWRRLLPRRRPVPLAAAAAILFAALLGGMLAWSSTRGSTSDSPSILEVAFGAEPLPFASMETGIPFARLDPPGAR
jgi:predicted anti-sigma-YlaC factor YlaD